MGSTACHDMREDNFCMYFALYFQLLVDYISSCESDGQSACLFRLTGNIRARVTCSALVYFGVTSDYTEACHSSYFLSTCTESNLSRGIHPETLRHLHGRIDFQFFSG